MSPQSRHEVSEEVAKAAGMAIDDEDRYDKLGYHLKVGGEQMVPTGIIPGGVMYYRHTHIQIMGDMDDLETLQQVSDLCDRFGLTTDSHHGEPLTGDDWANLVLDEDEH